MLKYLMNKYNELQAKKDEGFTLIELVIVIVIIAILALIMVPGITGYIEKADASKAQANLRSAYTTIQLVAGEEGKAFKDVTEGDLEDDIKGFELTTGTEEGKFKIDKDGETLILYGKGDRVFTFDGAAFTDSKNPESDPVVTPDPGE